MHIPQLVTTVETLIAADQPAWIWGKPGVGKSDVVRQIAADRGAVLADIRLSMFDPVDLRGLPAVVDGKTQWLRPAIWPTDPDRETILFFDELDRAAPAVANAALQIVLDRRIGEHELPPSVRIVAAGNGKTDRVGTNRISSAQANRFCHLDVEADPEAWRQWATGAGLAPELVAFMHFRPALLETDSKDGRTFASPRQWERVNRFMTAPDHIRSGIVSGLVGEPAGEFEAFVRTFRALPRIADILANPTGVDVPADLSARYAVATALARAATPGNFGAVISYMERLPREYTTLCVTDAQNRDKTLCDTQAFISWQVKNQDVSL